MEAEDRKRFEFVNGIVGQVEKRKIFTKDKNVQDKIDSVITHKIIGIPIFRRLFSWCFTYHRRRWDLDRMAGSLDRNLPGLFGSMMENANPVLYALLLMVWLVVWAPPFGFLPLVMVMYFRSLLEECGYMARATVVLDPFSKEWVFPANRLSPW